jgi:hypothetical protein
MNFALDKGLCLSRIRKNVPSREISTRFSERKLNFAKQVEILLLGVSKVKKISLFKGRKSCPKRAIFL